MLKKILAFAVCAALPFAMIHAESKTFTSKNSRFHTAETQNKFSVSEGIASLESALQALRESDRRETPPILEAHQHLRGAIELLNPLKNLPHTSISVPLQKALKQISSAKEKIQNSFHGPHIHLDKALQDIKEAQSFLRVSIKHFTKRVLLMQQN